jgi:hypothetical protein
LRKKAEGWLMLKRICPARVDPSPGFDAKSNGVTESADPASISRFKKST